MPMTPKETLSVQLERLRALFTLLEFVPNGQRHAELLDRARLAIADIRETRRALAMNDSRRANAAQTGQTFGCSIDYAAAAR